MKILLAILLLAPIVTLGDIQQRGHVWGEPAVTWLDVNKQSGKLDPAEADLVRVEWHGQLVALVEVDYGIGVSGSHAWEGYVIFEDGSTLLLWSRRDKWKSVRHLRAEHNGRWLVEWRNEGQQSWRELLRIKEVTK